VLEEVGRYRGIVVPSAGSPLRGGAGQVEGWREDGVSMVEGDNEELRRSTRA
jgi:hypothetical protein